MDKQLLARAGAIFAGGALGTGARLGLLAMLGSEVVALAVANLLGCFALGLVSGHYGSRVSTLRLFLAVGAVAAFTSWSSLALQGIANGGQLVVVVFEVAFGIFFAGLGHWLVWTRRARRPG